MHSGSESRLLHVDVHVVVVDERGEIMSEKEELRIRMKKHEAMMNSWEA
jgi:hypothetical protein